MFSSDFLMLSACEPLITDRFSSCFNAVVLFSFRNAICLLRPSISASSAVLLRAASALSSSQVFRLACVCAYWALSAAFFACSALNFLELTHENKVREQE